MSMLLAPCQAMRFCVNSLMVCTGLEEAEKNEKNSFHPLFRAARYALDSLLIVSPALVAKLPVLSKLNVVVITAELLYNREFYGKIITFPFKALGELMELN